MTSLLLYLVCIVVLLTNATLVQTFVLCPPSWEVGERQHHVQTTASSFLLYCDASSGTFMDTTATRKTVSELKKALDELNIDYSDCFDKESLIQRLQETQSVTAATATNRNSFKDTSLTTSDEILQQQQQRLEQIRSQSVKALRGELASHHRRYTGMLEKEDLVQAVYQIRQEKINFSATGRVLPGMVTDVTGDELEMEINHKGASSTTLVASNHKSIQTPLLVDVYATWCGPCQMLKGEITQVAQELSTRVRIVQMDSDKYQRMASTLRVQGLPTLILFSSNGQEIDRMEGALRKNQLLKWVESRI